MYYFFSVFVRGWDGATRSNNSVENFHKHSVHNVVQGHHVSLWKLIDSIKILQRSTNLDLASLSRGEVKKVSRKQETRNRGIRTLMESIKMIMMLSNFVAESLNVTGSFLYLFLFSIK